MAHSIVDDKCNGCTVCALKCPSQGIIGQRKEVHRIDPQLCVDCRTCGRWCPKEAVLDAQGEPVPRIKAKQIPRAQVDVDLCSGCEQCVDGCPFDCIAMVDYSDQVEFYQVAQVNPKKCVGCQFCQTHCLKEAITVDAGALDRPSDLQLGVRLLCEIP